MPLFLQSSCSLDSSASDGQPTHADPECHARAIIGQISRNAAHMSVLRRKLYMVEMWTSKRLLTPALCSKIRTYYAEIWLEHNGESPGQHHQDLHVRCVQSCERRL